jgi:Tol biopolymer transport system component
MNAFCKFRSFTLIPLVFGLIAWIGAAPTPKGLSGRIVFVHCPDDSAPWPTTDIYTLNADGTELRALTADGHSHTPRWSPDGRHILYIHDNFLPGGTPVGVHPQYASHFATELYVMDSNGGNMHLLRRLEGPIASAAWSPDGKTLAVCYCSNYTLPSGSGLRIRDDKAYGLYLIPAEGPGEPRLLCPRAGLPAWSPDGNKLAFAVPLSQFASVITVASADGSHQIRLTDPHRIHEASTPAWSPDGKEIAFRAVVDVRNPLGSQGQEQVFVMRADGSAIRRLTTDRQSECGVPKWSPDGRQIAFDAETYAPGPRGGSVQQQVFVVGPDGSNIRQLTTDPQWQCGSPAWSPGGTEMAFYCRSAYAPCPSGYVGPPGMPEPGCVRRIFVMSLRDPHAKPIQITQHDGAFPVFAPVP